ncbi:hypothetical protein BIW11_09147 [Tropilaelaps mercedesae]|uniref:Secreted protein n=1 Tax=Tropilaelaps mercedesae TaxID=418985 RepID=A0A1V9XLT8_9ACAR|nr:hypothetical protein BIW11_09147 [Tropilaelaps mercedesae]
MANVVVTVLIVFRAPFGALKGCTKSNFDKQFRREPQRFALSPGDGLGSMGRPLYNGTVCGYKLQQLRFHPAALRSFSALTPRPTTMKFFVLVTLASMALAAPQCDIQAVDRCLQKRLPFVNNTMAASTPQALIEQCKQDREAIQCLIGYADLGCLKGDALQAYRFLIAGTAKESALRCQEGTERYDAYFEYIPCANKAGEEINKCMRRATAYVEAAASTGAARKSYTCCVFDCLATCLGDAVAEKCPDQPSVKQYFRNTIGSVSGKYLDGYCGAYSLGSKECKALPELNIGEPKYRTLYGALIEYLASK